VTGNSKEIWVGLVGIRPDADNNMFEGSKGAYTNAVALAKDRVSYCAAVTRALKERKMAPFEFEDIEPLRVRTAHFEVPFNILSMAEQTEMDGMVRFGAFFTYEN